jgi:ParB family chromosome partitioning protein
MDPKSIRPSRWANRHADSFASAEFEAFKAEIADAGGNVQPIKVRPLPAGQGDGACYELVFGHRRHRACLDLGLPVLAVVQDLDERSMWAEMERENRARANLSAWEQGMHYRRALDAQLFPSMRMLAQAIGASHGTVSKALTIAQLPDEVVAAFPSPNAISFAWAADLRSALERDAPAVLDAASGMPQGLAAQDVFRRLVGGGSTRTTSEKESGSTGTTPPRRLDLGRGRHAEVRARGGRVTLELDEELMPSGGWEALEKALRKITGGAK